MRHHDAVLAGVAGDDRILGQPAHQFADHPLRQDRPVVGGIGAIVEIALLLAMRGDPPLGLLAAVAATRADLLDRALFQVAYYIILFPGICLSLTVLAVNLVGDGLRDALDPRLARRM